MSVEKLYKDIIFGSNREVSNQQVLAVSSEILSSETTLEIKASTLTVYTYKCIELDLKENNHFNIYNSCIQKLNAKLKGESSENHFNKNVREDEFQLLISLIISQWHWLIHSGAPLDELLNILENNVALIFSVKNWKPSYSLNVFKTLLLLSALYFIQGEKEKQISLSSKSLSCYKKIISNIKGNIPSSHFADIGNANESIETMLAGVEWVKGRRYRQNKWNSTKITQAISRINLNEYPHFMSKNSKIFSPTFFERT